MLTLIHTPCIVLTILNVYVVVKNIYMLMCSCAPFVVSVTRPRPKKIYMVSFKD